MSLVVDDPTAIETIDETALVASICRQSFYQFVLNFAPLTMPTKFRDNWHIRVLCDELQRVAERVFKGESSPGDFVCNISPGTTKSTIVSVCLPAWIWTRMPECQFICVSYSQLLALELSRKCRDLIKCDQYRECFPEVQIRDDSDSKSNFINTAGGKRYASGSQGSVIGMHAHVVIVDDPIDPNRALSDVILGNTNHWIQHTLSSRLVDKSISVTILVMQRVHQNDPTDIISQRPGCRWIRIPATTEYEIKPPELVNYYVNGLMDPVGLPQTYLDKISHPVSGIGQQAVAGQYGQSPSPAQGNLFKIGNLRWGRPPDHFKRLVRAWDKAGTQAKSFVGRGPAFTVGTLMGVDYEDRIWILNVKRFREDSFTREKIIKQTALEDGRTVIVAVEQEPGSSGKESAYGTMKRLMGIAQVRCIPATGTKEMRAEEFSVAVNGQNVWLPIHLKAGNRWVGWALAWVDELKHFPHGTYVDQCDSASIGFTALMKDRIRAGAILSKKQLAERRAAMYGG